MARYSDLPRGLVELAWLHGKGGELLRIPPGPGPTEHRAVLADLLRRAEKRLHILCQRHTHPEGWAVKQALEDAWTSIGGERKIYKLVMESVHQLKSEAPRHLRRWWSRGERARVIELRRRKDGAEELGHYLSARGAIIDGQSVAHVPVDILKLATESVADAWWHHAEPRWRYGAVVPEVVKLAFQRLPKDVDKVPLDMAAAARLGLTPEEAVELSRDMDAATEVTCGVLQERVA